MMQLLFLLFFTVPVNSPVNFDLEDYTTQKYMHFAEEKKELYVFYKDSLVIISIPELIVKNNLHIDNPDKINYNRYTFVSNKEAVFLVEGLGGLVYKLVGNKLIRIDRSFSHKMQISSTIFFYNDTIFRYGGYGFWSQRNFFTYFDSGTHEWEAMFPENGNSIPKGSQSSSIVIDEKDIYVYGGVHLSPFNYEDFLQNKEVWKFNTENKEWTSLGKFTVDLQGSQEFKKPNIPFNYGGKQIYVVDNALYVVDVINNRLKAYNLTSVQTKMRPPLQSFFSDGVFYVFIKRFSVESRYELITRNEDEFFGELLYDKPFYRTSKWINVLLYGLGALVLIALVYFFRLNRYRKQNKIILIKDRLIYKGKGLAMDPKMVAIIRLLLETDKEVTAAEIMNITENKSLNYAHNIRVKNNIIEDINFKIKALLDKKTNVIHVRKSDLDKRMKVYTIERDWFYLKKLTKHR